MKTLDQLTLAPSQRQALSEIRRRLIEAFGVESVTLFGSVVRGEADEESDIDLLVVTRSPLKRAERHRITDLVCEINLAYDANFSTLVVDRAAWEEGRLSVLPIHDEITREGIPL